MFDDVEGQEKGVDEGRGEAVIWGRGEGEEVDCWLIGGWVGAGDGAGGGRDGEGEEWRCGGGHDAGGGTVSKGCCSLLVGGCVRV